MRKFVLLVFVAFQAFFTNAQGLKPGFDIDEYIELLKVIKVQFNEFQKDKYFPKPEHSKLLYSSKETGLRNQWNLWLRDDNVAIVSIRGSVPFMSSWIENFYLPLVPAQGEFVFGDSAVFTYKLAEDTNAAVHAGWLLGLASMAGDMTSRLKHLMDSIQNLQGIIITGHSQGGAISYLTTAYFHYLIKDGKFPEIKIKTYCSAAPKPGNLFFAYDYETYTGNWAYNIVNVADWVPQVPLGVETIDDLNPVNPFINAKEDISKFKFPKNLVLKKIYNKVKGGADDARDYYIYYFGKKLYPRVEAFKKSFNEPVYVRSMDYQRCGNYIILRPDKEYLEKYPYKVKDVNKHIFLHHFLKPYLMLARKYKKVNSGKN